MRAVAQRVTSAQVTVDGEIVGTIGEGLLVFLGAAEGDSDADLDYVVRKLSGLRVFRDAGDRMAYSVVDAAGAVLLVPQFTLFGDVRRGLRPSFDGAASPEEGRRLFDATVAKLRALELPVETGRFRAKMDVAASVDGPVTILIDSRKLF